MDPTLIIDLTEILKEYVPFAELQELTELFDVSMPDEEANHPYLQLSKELIGSPNSGSNGKFVAKLLDLSLQRSRKGIAYTKWALQDHHSAMFDKVTSVQSRISQVGIVEEVTVSESSPFTAKSHVRDMLDQAITSVKIVDQYIGARTLDCLRGVTESIFILTGKKRQSLENGFSRSLEDFKAEGHIVEVRAHQNLHDRYMIFNDRCWLVGGSLKDAGKKTFSVIEVVDTKQAIIDSVERKWQEAERVD